jgi:hypothetical protein
MPDDAETLKQLEKIKEMRAMVLKNIETAENGLGNLITEVRHVKGYGGLLNYDAYHDAATLLRLALEKVERCH